MYMCMYITAPPIVPPRCCCCCCYVLVQARVRLVCILQVVLAWGPALWALQRHLPRGLVGSHAPVLLQYPHIVRGRQGAAVPLYCGNIVCFLCVLGLAVAMGTLCACAFECACL
jgi:hypothetical protein